MADFLGLVTFLVGFFWLPFCIFGLPQVLQRFGWYWKLPAKRQNELPVIIGLVGTGALLLLYYFVLPTWWTEATPVWVDGR